MSLLSATLLLILLIIISAIVSSAEIALAGARRIKLQNMVNEGNAKAALVLKLQEQPGRFITVVQIGTWRGHWRSDNSRTFASLH